MQGQRSSVSTFSENISFDYGSTSGDAAIDSQISWNSIQTSGQSQQREFRISSVETNVPYLQHVRREGSSLGESSSSGSQRQGGQSEGKPEHSWAAFHPQGALAFEEQQHEPSNILSLDNVDINSNSNLATNGSFVLQNLGSPVIPRDLNINSEIGDQVDNDDCQVIECPAAYLSVGPSTAQTRSTGRSSAQFTRRSGYLMDESEGRSDCSLDGRRMSCKRKALEGHTGQSSGTGSSNSFHTSERNQWHTLPAAPIATNISMPMPHAVMDNGSEPANPRLRIGVGGAASTNPFPLMAPPGSGASHGNFCLRINGLHQQEPIAESPLLTDSNGNADISSSRHSSRLVLNNQLFELNPSPAVENVNIHGRPILQPAPHVRRNLPSRWSAAPNTRASSSSAPAIPEVRPSVPYLEPTSRNIPRNSLEHPLPIPASEMGNTAQNPTNWNLSSGNYNIAGNVASAPQVGPSTGAGPSAPSWPRRGCPQYPRRLSEYVQRSLLSSAGTRPGGHRSSRVVQSGSPASQETALPPGPDYHRHRALSSRSSMLGRHHDGTFGIPYSLRALAAAGEGRSGVMSEQICHVLDLMRRGEGLRLEDVMILEHPVLFGMADIHDRHRDMRMDVDNMSYEELLALEERIGNVCTGLSEETITNHLKQEKHIDNHGETQPCSICREEYNGGEPVGILDCGHTFHADCIKQWLMQKNLCPICKATGLTAT